MRSLAECAESIHPEVRYEVRSRSYSRVSPARNDDDDDDDEGEGEAYENSKPFPFLPWVSATSCGLAWRPFPIQNYHAGNNGGHRLLSSPHFVRADVRVALPRPSLVVSRKRRRRARRNESGSDTAYLDDDGGGEGRRRRRSRNKELEFGVAYREADPAVEKGGDIEFSAESSRRDDQGRRGGRVLVRMATSPTTTPLSTTMRKKSSSAAATTTTDENSGGSSPTENESTTTARATTLRLLPPATYAETSFRLPSLPFLSSSASSNSWTMVPSYDFVERRVRCVLSGLVGTSGRTRAVLRLAGKDHAGGGNTDSSTLTLARTLEDGKVIAPTISLRSGKIVCDWYLALKKKNGDGNADEGHFSSLRAHVDPMSGIHVVWTDRAGNGRVVGGGKSGGGGNSFLGGGCWVAECKVPLRAATSNGPFAVDVRVGRRWVV